MTFRDPVSELRRLLPREKVVSDLHSVLLENSDSIDLENRTIEYSTEMGLEILYREFVDDYVGAFFARYRTGLSIGKSSCDSSGTIKSEFCFAILNYNENLDLITIDFDDALY